MDQEQQVGVNDGKTKLSIFRNRFHHTSLTLRVSGE